MRTAAVILGPAYRARGVALLVCIFAMLIVSALVILVLDIATTDMALDADEVEFTGWGSTVTAQPVQFGEEEPMVALARLMFVDGFVPVFDGRGVLKQALALISNIPTRIYLDDQVIVTMDRPFSQLNPPNSIWIKGLSATMSKVIQPRQVLGGITITTGYFTQDESISTFWSEDNTLLGQNVAIDVKRSVNGGLTGLGAEEVFTLIPAPSGLEGSIGMRADISTGFAPWIILVLTIIYVVLSAIPDAAGVVFTIPIGRVIQAIALAAVLLIMTKIGKGEYDFVGEPFEYVFAEISGRAELAGLLSGEVVELIIENHLINDQTVLNTLARDVLFEQQASGQPRAFSNMFDLRLELNDEFEALTGRGFKIKGIQRALKRTSQGNEALAAIDAFEITGGLNP